MVFVCDHGKKAAQKSQYKAYSAKYVWKAQNLYFRDSCANPANFGLCNAQKVRFYIGLHHMYSQDQIIPDDSTPNPSKLCTVPSPYLLRTLGRT